MALIETAPNSESCENNLRMACADEFAAINLYKNLKAKKISEVFQRHLNKIQI